MWVTMQGLGPPPHVSSNPVGVKPDYAGDTTKNFHIMKNSLESIRFGLSTGKCIEEMMELHDNMTLTSSDLLQI